MTEIEYVTHARINVICAKPVLAGDVVYVRKHGAVAPYTNYARRKGHVPIGVAQHNSDAQNVVEIGLTFPKGMLK